MQYYQECVALGSKTGISLISNAPSMQTGELFQKLWKEIFLFERQFSRFLPGSELSVFNRNAGMKQPVSPEFHDILITAREMAGMTKGLYNPFVLPALQAAGYRNSRVPGYENDVVDDYSGRSLVPVDRLEVGNDWARIPYGTAIDLGGCGKGYIADRLSRALPDDIAGYWLSFGGDIAVGGHDEHGAAWDVLVQGTDNTNVSVGKITVAKPVGVATSGTTVHHGKRAGKTWHHIIDPRTGHPAKTDVVLATVCHDSPLHADVLASCAVILGGEAGMQFLKSRGVKAAVIQGSKGRIEHFGDVIISDNVHA